MVPAVHTWDALENAGGRMSVALALLWWGSLIRLSLASGPILLESVAPPRCSPAFLILVDGSFSAFLFPVTRVLALVRCGVGSP